MEGGQFAAAQPSIVRKEIGGALAWNRGHLPFKLLSKKGIATYTASFAFDTSMSKPKHTWC